MYRKLNKSWLKHLDFEIVDLICIEIAFVIAFLFRHKEVLRDMIDWYAQLGLILFAIQCLVIFFSQSYKGIIQRSAGAEFWAAIQHVTSVEVIFVVYEFIIKETYLLSRYVILVSWGLGVLLCFAGRQLLKLYVRSRLTSPRNQSAMLVITNTERARTCMERILAKKIREYRVTCIALHGEDVHQEKTQEEIDVIYGKEEFWEYVRTHIVDEVYVDVFDNKEELNASVQELLAMGITVHVGMGFITEDFPNPFVEKVGNSHVVTTSIKTAQSWEIAAKRMMDIVGSLIGLVLLGIAFVFVAPIIKKESPGPIFFKQKRVGRNGRIFNLYKFRSMNIDAEEHQQELLKDNEMQGLMFKIENDPRIIGYEKGQKKSIGYFIRRTSIDELPQFWNVLKGDMSLVGTRPPTLQEFEQYDRHHKIRLSMKPGITGMWQTSGRSDISDFEEIVKLDAKYIETWSLGLDLKILLKTIVVVFNRVGAK